MYESYDSVHHTRHKSYDATDVPTCHGPGAVSEDSSAF